MIEKTVYEYLSTRIDVPVFMELPEVPSEDHPEWPDRFVVIQKIGGGKLDHIRSASFAFQSYSLTSLYEAAALDEEVQAVMDNMAVLDNIGSCSLASNYEFTDTRTKRYRYQCTYDIYYKED